MIRRPPRSTRTDTLLPYTTLFRSLLELAAVVAVAGGPFLDRCHGAGMAGIGIAPRDALAHRRIRSEEHTSDLQSLMRISYAVFCLKKKNVTSVPAIT